MANRLPTPVLLVAFEPTATLPDCLRAAHNTARLLQVGIGFAFGPAEDLTEYLVQPWMQIEDVLALWDAAQAASVAEHIGAHSD